MESANDNSNEAPERKLKSIVLRLSDLHVEVSFLAVLDTSWQGLKSSKY